MMCKQKLGSDDKELPDIGAPQTNRRWVAGTNHQVAQADPLALPANRIHRLRKVN